MSEVHSVKIFLIEIELVFLKKFNNHFIWIFYTIFQHNGRRTFRTGKKFVRNFFLLSLCKPYTQSKIIDFSLPIHLTNVWIHIYWPYIFMFVLMLFSLLFLVFCFSHGDDSKQNNKRFIFFYRFRPLIELGKGIQ